MFSGNWVVPVFVAAWVVIVILPLLVMVAHSFFEMKNYQVSYDASFKTWNSLIDSGRWIAAVRTLRVVLMMTVVEFLIAFPFALWLAKTCKSKVTKAVIITLLTIPFFLDPSSRTIIWRAILGKNGIINTVLMELGIISEPMEWMLFSEFAVHFGMLAPYFPTMVFPIFLVVSLIDDHYLEASRDLGASKLHTLLLHHPAALAAGHRRRRRLHHGAAYGDLGGAGDAGRGLRELARPVGRSRDSESEVSDRGGALSLRHHRACAVAYAADPWRRGAWAPSATSSRR